SQSADSWFPSDGEPQVAGGNREARSRWGRAGITSSRSQSSPPGRSTSLADAHPVHPIADRYFGVFSVADIAAIRADAIFPSYRSAGAPGRRNLRHGQPRSSRVALALLSWLARWQTCST